MDGGVSLAKSPKLGVRYARGDCDEERFLACNA